MGIDLVDAQVALADAVSAWCSRSAARSAARGEKAAQWALIGAETRLEYGSAFLADSSIERTLRASSDAIHESAKRATNTALKWLHVFTMSYTTGGHTALARRWIELDPSSDMHDLVTTYQSMPEVAPALVRAVVNRKGMVTALTPDHESLSERAHVLRRMASKYDAVVLHVHQWDPVPVMAFGSPGGPPVFFLNHADHTFWLGSSVSDRVLNIRPSGEFLCHGQRGVNRIFRLALPLPEATTRVGDPIGAALRHSHGIDADATVFLTIGTAFKYRPLPDFSFFDAADQLLDRVPNSHLIAVGPDNDSPDWTGLRSKFGTRVHMVGLQLDIKPFFAAANVYLEGFPFGSLTALLEAVLAGLPPVLAPARCPLPYRSDDFALDSVPVPADIEAYVEQAVQLANERQRGAARGAELSALVHQAHCPSGWTTQLNALRELVLKGLRHDVYELLPLLPLDATRVRYWAAFAQTGTGDVANAFQAAFAKALTQGLHPTVDWMLFRAIAVARAAGVQVAKPWVAAIGSRVLARLPHATAVRMYLG